MRTSFRARVSSSSRRGRGEQGLGVQKHSQLEQGGDGDARAGFIAQEAARVGIEHPGRNGQEGAVRELDEEALFGLATKAAHEVALLIEKRMMAIANAYRRR
jgi:hypothetical protein